MINEKARASRWASDFIIVPCLASAVGISVAMFLIKQAETTGRHKDINDQADLGYSGIILCLAKELMYLFMAFWYVARVNERADELTIKLSDGFWGDYGMLDRVSVQLPDLHRLSIHASSVSKPICYSLLFKRVSKWNVLMSALGFGLTLMTKTLQDHINIGLSGI